MANTLKYFVFVLALTSAISVHQMSSQFLMKFFSNIWLYSILALIPVYIFYKLIEDRLPEFLDFAMSVIAQEKSIMDKSFKENLLLLSVLVVLSFRLGVSGSMTLFLHYDIEQKVTAQEEPEIEELTIVKDQNAKQRKEAIKDYDKTIEIAEKSLSQAKGNLEASKKEAIKSKGAEMERLYNEGNKWAISKLTPAINKAVRDNRGNISRAQKQVDAAIAAKNSYLQNQSESKLESTLSDIYVSKMNTAKIKGKMAASWWKYGSIILVLVTLSLAYINFIINGKETVSVTETKTVKNNGNNGYLNTNNGNLTETVTANLTVKEPLPVAEITVSENRICRNCSKDISDMRKGAKYCNSRCKNEAYKKIKSIQIA